MTTPHPTRRPEDPETRHRCDRRKTTLRAARFIQRLDHEPASDHDHERSRLEQARAIAGDKEIDVAGGASAVRQGLQAGAIDELVLDIAPVLLGAGEQDLRRRR
jgi:dihydrofolate reductase